MLIFFATETQINEAIERANEVYGNNLIWDLKLSPNIHPVLKVWGINASIHVTDCKGPGHRLAHPAIHGGRPVEIFSASGMCTTRYSSSCQTMQQSSLTENSIT